MREWGWVQDYAASEFEMRFEVELAVLKHRRAQASQKEHTQETKI